MKHVKLKTICTLAVLLMAGCTAPNNSTNDIENTGPPQTSLTTVKGIIQEVSDTSFTLQSADTTLHFDTASTIFHPEEVKIAKDDEATITYNEPVEDANHIPAIEVWITKLKKAEKPENQPKDDPIMDLLNTMSLEQKIGQMFLARCPSENATQIAQQYQLGGYMLFDPNIRNQTRDSLAANIASYQEVSNIPMLIAIDEEGGTVNRLSWYLEFRGVPFWSPHDLYETGGITEIQRDLDEKATLLQSLGINTNLAPVADVAYAETDYIYPRTLSLDAQTTADYIKEVILKNKELKMGCVMKHFPGYGNNVDTHTGIAYDERSLDSFRTHDFLPFKAGIDAGAQAILVNHNIIVNIDGDMPASLSKNVHDVLRNELGFNGVIMTDDLDMDAVKQLTNDGTEVAVTAILAGNDMILCSNYGEQIPNVVAAVENGTISEKQINDSIYRILTWKSQIGLI